MKFKTLSPYIFAFLLTALSVAIQYVVIVNARIAVPGLLYPTTFLIAWYFGFRPSLFSIIVGTLGALFFFYEPRFTFKILKLDDGVRLTIFALTSLLAAGIVARGKEAEAGEYEARFALTELQKRFQRSSTALNLGIWYCDLPFKTLVCNSEMRKHYFLPEHDEITIDNANERIHPDDLERTNKAVKDAIAHGSRYDTIYRTVNPNNSSDVKYIRAIGWTEYDEVTGKPIRFDGITIDSTELHNVSSERDESVEVLATINQVGKMVAAELDQQQLVQKVTDVATQLSKAEFGAFFYNVINEKGESYTLYSVSGVPKEKFTQFPMPRKTEVFGPTFDGEGVIRSDDITKDPRYGKNEPYFGMPAGHLPVVSYLAVPVVSRTGEVLGGLFFGHKKPGMFTDREEKIVTGLASQAAVAMDNARLFDKANQAIQIRDEFLSISSHELRTPLTPLKMQIQNIGRQLEKGSLSDEGAKKMIAMADKQVNRLTSLVDDLLDVSRITSGRLTLNFEETDLVVVTREICERYTSQLQTAGCELSTHLIPSLIINVDRLRFEQILINLLTNAIKYAPGKPISVSLSVEGGDAVLKVADQGMGITVEDQKRIFDRFERVSNNVSQTGLGLGLYIVNQIVSAHGGTIQVKSGKNKGAEFEVKIPLRKKV